jgi:hypothetical protein
MKKLLAGLIIVAGFFVYIVTQHPPVAGTEVATTTVAYSQGILPDPTLTPGVLNPDINQGNIQDNLCNHAWSTKSIRPTAQYTTALKIKQLASGYTPNGDTATKDFEEDHLISLELGGSPVDEQNLWPEPYFTTLNGQTMGAKQKDTTENYLHNQVCSGAMTLDEAQRNINRLGSGVSVNGSDSTHVW